MIFYESYPHCCQPDNTVKTNEEVDVELQQAITGLGTFLHWFGPPITRNRPKFIPTPRTKVVARKMRTLYYELVDALNEDYKEAEDAST